MNLVFSSLRRGLHPLEELDEAGVIAHAVPDRIDPSEEPVQPPAIDVPLEPVQGGIPVAE